MTTRYRAGLKCVAILFVFGSLNVGNYADTLKLSEGKFVMIDSILNTKSPALYYYFFLVKSSIRHYWTDSAVERQLLLFLN